MYLHGRGRCLVVTAERLTVTTYEGFPVADFALNDIARFAAFGGEAGFRECIWFTSPAVVLEGANLYRNPYVLEVDRENVEELSRFAEVSAERLRAVRRIPSSPPNVPPHPHSQELRTDLAAAAERMGAGADALGRAELLAAMSENYLRDDELVLDAALTLVRSVGLFVLTSLRVIYISIRDGVYEETGLAAYRQFLRYADDDRLVLDDGVHVFRFVLENPTADLTRLIESGEAALRAVSRAGRLPACEPSPATLFEEFELITERYALQMISKDDFGNQLRGVLSAMPR